MTVKFIRVGKPAFKPTASFENALRRNLHVAMAKIKDRQLIYRNRVTNTWTGDRPRWAIHIQFGALEARLAIGFNSWGEKKSGNRKWLWLSEGTDVRFAAMTDDFQAKTAHRQINSTAGRGGLWYVGIRPLAGIDERLFDNEIMTQLAPQTGADIRFAFVSALEGK